MKRTRLPRGWKIIPHYCWDQGTGMGDDMYDPALFRFMKVTHGHLWWKKTRYEWVLCKVLRFSHNDFAQTLIDIAWTQIDAEKFAMEEGLATA